jgi:putative transposase
MKLVEATLQSIPVKRPRVTKKHPQHLCLDAGYDYPEVHELVEGWGFMAHIRPRRAEAGSNPRIPGYRARRWVVERTHSWMNRFRRLLIRWEKKVENYIAMLHFACAWITFRAAGVFG